MSDAEPSPAGTPGPFGKPASLPIEALKPAYEQVAERLRELIVSGAVKAGHRLPNETELCQQFGTSRSTIREALRLLAAQGLVRAKRGARGGISVAAPTPREVMSYLDTSLGLMAGVGELSAEELLEARALIEVAAAGAAAQDADPAQIGELRSCIPAEPSSLSRDDLFEMNLAFHGAILRASHNRLLELLAEPIFMTLRRRFLAGVPSRGYFREVLDDHSAVVDAIEAGDPMAAEAAMAAHLAHLAPSYGGDGQLAQ
jgi:DNA-binding FadR family transcriptional regulator